MPPELIFYPNLLLPSNSIDLQNTYMCPNEYMKLEEKFFKKQNHLVQSQIEKYRMKNHFSLVDNPKERFTKTEEIQNQNAIDVDVNVIQEYVCPDCYKKFPFPESDPKTQFNTNFTCHVLFFHIRAEVLTEMDQDEMEVCPVVDCSYNIVQFKEDEVPDAESFLIKHYISKHFDLLVPLIRKHPKYRESSCLQAAHTDSKPTSSSQQKLNRLPNIKIKPIFLDKFLKFAQNSSSCTGLHETDPMHVVMFLTEWTSQRNYTWKGIEVLVVFDSLSFPVIIANLSNDSH